MRKKTHDNLEHFSNKLLFYPNMLQHEFIPYFDKLHAEQYTILFADKVKK